jgi:hypothetical protein
MNVSYLLAVTVLIGVVALANLIFTVAVVRRLREHTAALARLDVTAVGIPVGQAPGSFSATTVDGQRLTLNDIGSTAIVGFFSLDCDPCRELLPDFETYLRAGADGHEVVAVLVGTTDECSDAAERLLPLARVVIEPPAGALQTAFGNRHYPEIVLLADGVVMSSGPDLSQVPKAVFASGKAGG